MKLKQKREALGMSQMELADRAELSVRVLQNYEQGTRPINGARAITVYKIALALGCTVEELLELDEIKK